MDDPETGAPHGLYKQDGAALWRYALLLTGDPSRAADIVQETVLRARRRPENADNPARSARAWLFAVARELIIERRSARFWHDTEAHGSRLPERAGTDQVNAALDRLLLGDALAQLSPDHRAVIRCAYYNGCTTTQIAADLNIAEATVKARLHHAAHALSLQLREMGVTSVRQP